MPCTGTTSRGNACSSFVVSGQPKAGEYQLLILLCVLLDSLLFLWCGHTAVTENDNSCDVLRSCFKILTRVQVVTGGGSFSECVPPEGLRCDSPPSAFLQQRALRRRFVDYFTNACDSTLTVMHGRQLFSNITRLGVRC